MYLLAITFLFIGLLSAVTQMLAVQTARLYQNQSGIGQAMLMWHEAAASLAANVINPTNAEGGAPVDIVGCRLSSTTGWASPPVACETSPTSPIVTPVGAAAIVTGSFAVTSGGQTNIYPDIPPGYSTGGVYQWKSLTFQNTNSFYVITYVDPPAGGGDISTTTTQLGITLADLHQQLKNAGVPSLALGYIASGGGTLVTTAQLTTGATLTYAVPTWIPVNSLAIISQPGTCTTC